MAKTLREDPIRAARMAKAALKSIEEHGHTGRIISEKGKQVLDFEFDVADLSSTPLKVVETLSGALMSEMLDDQNEMPWTGVDDSTFDLDLSRQADIIRVRGELKVAVKHMCGRCLEDVIYDLDLYVDLILSHTIASGSFSEGAEFAEGEEVGEEGMSEDLDLIRFDGKKIELDQILREQIFLELPAHPFCRQGRDHRQCELDKEGALKREQESWTDPRWDALKGLKEKLKKS